MPIFNRRTLYLCSLAVWQCSLYINKAPAAKKKLEFVLQSSQDPALRVRHPQGWILHLVVAFAFLQGWVPLLVVATMTTTSWLYQQWRPPADATNIDDHQLSSPSTTIPPVISTIPIISTCIDCNLLTKINCYLLLYCNLTFSIVPWLSVTPMFNTKKIICGVNVLIGPTTC